MAWPLLDGLLFGKAAGNKLSGPLSSSRTTSGAKGEGVGEGLGGGPVHSPKKALSVSKRFVPKLKVEQLPSAGCLKLSSLQLSHLEFEHQAFPTITPLSHTI